MSLAELSVNFFVALFALIDPIGNVALVLGLILCAMAVQFMITGIAGATHDLVRHDAVAPYPSKT